MGLSMKLMLLFTFSARFCLGLSLVFRSDELISSWRFSQGLGKTIWQINFLMSSIIFWAWSSSSSWPVSFGSLLMSDFMSFSSSRMIFARTNPVGFSLLAKAPTPIEFHQYIFWYLEEYVSPYKNACLTA